MSDPIAETVAVVDPDQLVAGGAAVDLLRQEQVLFGQEVLVQVLSTIRPNRSMAGTIRIAAAASVAACVLLAASTAWRLPATGRPCFSTSCITTNRGVDQNEGVELAGPAETDLTGWRLVRYDGRDGRDHFTRQLCGIIKDQGGGCGTVLIGPPAANLQIRRQVPRALRRSAGRGSRM